MARLVLSESLAVARSVQSRPDGYVSGSILGRWFTRHFLRCLPQVVRVASDPCTGSDNTTAGGGDAGGGGGCGGDAGGGAVATTAHLTIAVDWGE